MPSILHFKTKSVIYFQGDHTSHFYLLRRGSVELSSDTHNKSEIIQPGFFFGTQATLIGKTQSQTAMATLPSEIVSFEYKEFLALIQSNETLRTSILKTFIDQLTGIHTQVLHLMSDATTEDEKVDFEHFLIKTANFFLKNRAYSQAKQSYERYIARFPNGEFINIAQEKADYSSQKIGGEDDLSTKLYLTVSEPANQQGSQLTPMQTEYEEMQVLLNQKKHSQALLRLTRLVRMESDPAFDTLIASCRYLLGETLMQMDKFADAIEPLSTFIAEHSEHDDIDRARLYLGLAYEKTNNENAAQGVYVKLLETLPVKSPMYNKVKQTLENLRKKKS
ncbi:cyclic nucleotide-binding domain-containing protein [Entomospira culicis]|uniref:Cyclic nucleotide-binding domain-containing protein n=1 Tax=Entomospira culicis TaxID=2719989 RepID=A0A968KV66_9SPIO|nr:cyclic nucleotide-binding domain-containing protein [Entomospira culicis]NIZ18568.1 cyclic nucleotide-binding domain-containing protein [Entomospira culicis]NIZ68783.1 cyclic nucleotide-binding domain-containing protein [Entomospira culicis]WDI37379.1 cyclic nucleotide-binding domain-containing protein [Entomospira culicis]WDI39008.1 cyclic nucleotide-binding domain-containing protein [Entomospira culicis]